MQHFQLTERSARACGYMMSGRGSARLGVLEQKRLHQRRWSGQRYDPAHQRRSSLLLLYLGCFLVIICPRRCERLVYEYFSFGCSTKPPTS
jgi:hypothetical protein